MTVKNAVAVFIMVLICPPAFGQSSESKPAWKLMGNADILMGQYFFEKQRGDINGYGNVELQLARSRSARSGFFLNYHGTVIKYEVPASVPSGHVYIRIYTVAGELVGELDQGVQQGGYYYYTEWDGRNKDGQRGRQRRVFRGHKHAGDQDEGYHFQNGGY